MRLVSPVLKRVVYPWLAKSGYLQRHADSGLAVVTYHGLIPEGYRINDPDLDGNLVSSDTFHRHVRLIKSKYNIISPEQFLGWVETQEALPPHSVLFTCDDGLRNTLGMLPILQSEGASCLFFITGGCLRETPALLWHEELYLMFLNNPETFIIAIPEIGGSMRAAGRTEKRALWSELLRKLSRVNTERRQAVLAQIRRQLGLRPDWLENQLRDPGFVCRFCLLDAAGVRQLVDAGMIIGAHTDSHPVLRELPEEVAWHEISSNRLDVERMVEKPVWAFAYPFGDPNSIGPREIQMAERAGFSCAFQNTDGGFSQRFARLAIPRLHVTREMSEAELEAHISGFYRRLRARSKFRSEDLPLVPRQCGTAT
jgi:peptidoglycan/xylan/chitin deacetylase (PgdA/CDA1 family)